MQAKSPRTYYCCASLESAANLACIIIAIQGIMTTGLIGLFTAIASFMAVGRQTKGSFRAVSIIAYLYGAMQAIASITFLVIALSWFNDQSSSTTFTVFAALALAFFGAAFNSFYAARVCRVREIGIEERARIAPVVFYPPQGYQPQIHPYAVSQV